MTYNNPTKQLHFKAPKPEPLSYLAAQERIMNLFEGELCKYERIKADRNLTISEVRCVTLLHTQLAKARDEVRKEQKSSVLEGKTEQEALQLLLAALIEKKGPDLLLDLLTDITGDQDGKVST